MKVKLNADWLDSDTKSKLIWIQEVRKDFGFTAAQIKPLADFFWLSTESLTLSKELIIDTSEFEILNSLGHKQCIHDSWISYSKAIQHHHTPEETNALKTQSNPHLLKQEQLDAEIKNLMLLIPEDKVHQVEEALKRVLAVHTSFSSPIG
jgi:hypothetical protein